MSIKRNPKWSTDELILTLDFYLKHRKSPPSQKSPEIMELSGLLGSLQDTLGGHIVTDSEKFRNPNGVYMKLMNFRSIDPEYEGVGLKGSSRTDKEVFEQFVGDPEYLSQMAESIKGAIAEEDPESITKFHFSAPLDPGEVEAKEGAIMTRIHKYRERDNKIIVVKKDQFFRINGRLFCEACTFNFRERYGPRGDGFIECHHKKAVSDLKFGEKTTLEDLALLCANCHRMVHTKRPWLSFNELKSIVKN